jgi:hypothetical protein
MKKTVRQQRKEIDDAISNINVTFEFSDELNSNIVRSGTKTLIYRESATNYQGNISFFGGIIHNDNYDNFVERFINGKEKGYVSSAADFLCGNPISECSSRMYASYDIKNMINSLQKA